jgi:hypothetical protein
MEIKLSYKEHTVLQTPLQFKQMEAGFYPAKKTMAMVVLVTSLS